MADLDDLAGVRVVMGTLAEQNTLCQFFRGGLRGVTHEVLKDRAISRDDGYRAHHIVLEVPSHQTGTWQTCKVEVQVQTVFQSAFNMLSRTWVYKTEKGLDDSWYRSFNQLSKKLEEVEIMTNDLQIALSKSNMGTSKDVPISPLAFQAIVDEIFGEVCDEDSANWYSLYYRRVGLENCGQLRRFFKNEDIEEVFQKYKARANESPEIIGGLSKNRHSFWHFCGADTKGAIDLLEKVCASKKAQE